MKKSKAMKFVGVCCLFILGIALSGHFAFAAGALAPAPVANVCDAMNCPTFKQKVIDVVKSVFRPMFVQEFNRSFGPAFNNAYENKSSVYVVKGNEGNWFCAQRNGRISACAKDDRQVYTAVPSCQDDFMIAGTAQIGGAVLRANENHWNNLLIVVNGVEVVSQTDGGLFGGDPYGEVAEQLVCPQGSQCAFYPGAQYSICAKRP